MGVNYRLDFEIIGFKKSKVQVKDLWFFGLYFIYKLYVFVIFLVVKMILINKGVYL